jgi:transcriptional regulator with XRE-family HTH domain
VFGRILDGLRSISDNAGMAKRVKLTDQIRKAIRRSGVSRYKIWQETGIAQSTLSKFLEGQRGLNLESLDKLADYLRIDLISHGPKEPD